MGEQPVNSSDSEATTVDKPPEKAEPERRIGPYRLLRELGHGGMGTVYLAARADDEYQKRVAIKIIRGLDSVEIVRHFRRERQILAALEHPNIARLLDGGTTDDGLPYFVMEHVEGQPIDRFCDERRLSIQERLVLFQGVCSAVQYAHRNLVVHRDIKPSNTLVTTGGVPKLMDFGIAKLLNPEIAGESPTATVLAMTPEYASPEQARGGAITTATDVYSLGVVLYELLTGHRPYRLKTHETFEVLKAVCEEEPERPSTAVGRMEERTRPDGTTQTTTPESVSRTREGSPERLKRRLQGDLDNIVLMALRKEPQRRYGSVEALSEDIRRYLEGRPVTARKATTWYRTSKFVRRNAVGVTALALLFLLAVGFSVTMAVQSRRIARERDKAERLAAFMVDLFRVSDPSEARGNTITAREVLDKGAARIAQELAGQPEVQGRLMSTMGTVYQSLGLYKDSAGLYRQSLDVRRRSLGSRDPAVAASLHDLGTLLVQSGDHAGAEAALNEALALRETLFGANSAEVAATVGSLAQLCYARGDYAKAETLFERQLQTLRRLGPGHEEALSDSLNDLAMTIQQTRSDYVGAQALLRESLEIHRRLFAGLHPKIAQSLNNLGMAHFRQHEYDLAEVLVRESLAMNRKLFGELHPEVSANLNNLALIARDRGDYAAASLLFAQVVEMDRRLLGPDHLDLASSLNNWGESLRLGGDATGAEKVLRESLAIHTRALPRGHWQIASTQTLIARCLVDQRRFGEAERLMLEAYPIVEAQFAPGHRRAKAVAERIVALYEAWGKPEKAAEYRAKMVEIK